uniref:Uncharacterized protein n=1 Tax=Sinocyclocheilus anshuiensis TaxID=1608454 RepID=A0A671KVP1_9TELE
SRIPCQLPRLGGFAQITDCLYIGNSKQFFGHTMHVPVSDDPESRLCDYFDPVADQIQHPSCTGCAGLGLIMVRPNSGFWKQLIEYKHKLHGKNTVHLINSPIGLIPDLYERETRVLIPL